MAVCKEMEKRLMAYLFDALENREKQEVELHLKSCPDCQKNLERLKAVQKCIESEPLAKAPDQLQDILSRARNREKARDADHLFQMVLASRVILFLKQNRPVRLGLAFGSLAIAFLLFWPMIAPRDTLYLVKATGPVSFSQGEPVAPKSSLYDIRKGTRIRTGSGECVIQINQDKLLVLEKGTEAKISADKEVRISLDKGCLIGYVHKETSAKRLNILAHNAVIRITGTVFYVKATNTGADCAVLNGLVQAIVSNRSHCIHAMEKIRIRGNRIESLDKMTAYDKIFDKIKPYKLRKKPDKLRKIMVMIEPAGSKILWKDQDLGQSPLFLLDDENQYSHLMIVQKGYLPREIDIRDMKEYHVVLEKEGGPQLVWDLKKENKVLTNPVYLDGCLFVTDEAGWLYSMDPGTSREIWKFKMGKGNDSTPVKVDNVLYISSNDEYLYALNFRTGALLWKRKVGVLVYSVPRHDKNKLYLCNNEGILYCLDPKSGETLWSRGVDREIYASPVIDEGRLYVGGLSGTLFAIDLNKGEKKWTFKTGSRIVGSTPLVRKNRIYFGSNDRYLYCLDKNTGNLIWKFDTGGEIFTSPLPINGNVFIGNVKGAM
ncbi:MAG: PQQ-binding-like beta-propeller repeat protein, partial [bacterium]|nr:PQQ-binding-like beta-propeller repeat protein [bacterium]